MNTSNTCFEPPAIVLVRPQMGENIGAAARAMMNFGLTDLRLVCPRDGWPNPRAYDMSSGALDKMPPVQVFEHLGDAVADCTFVYGTTARARDMNKPVSTVKEACLQTVSYKKTGFVFGPERTGLENEDAALCHELITVPTVPDFASINLAQAVLLITYEWFQAHQAYPDTMNRDDLATHAELDNLFNRLEQELDKKRFFRSDLRTTMVRNIRTMLMRAQFTTQEVNTMQGIISALIGNKVKNEQGSHENID